MLGFSVRAQVAIGIVLALLMGMTRGYHFTPLEHLPSASWAVFAYGLLLRAYGTLWFAGHWYAESHRDTATTLFPLAISVFSSAAICEVISSGSFYFLSGRFEQTSVMEFAARFAQYFPQSLSSLLFYVGIPAILHVSFGAVRTLRTPIDRFRTSS